MNEPVKAPQPSFSVIIPTFGDGKALAGTLNNILAQSELGRNADIEVLVMGDGFETQAKKLTEDAEGVARSHGLGCYFFYTPIKHSGSGNIPRAEGLRMARKDWVVFLDAGTGVTWRCFEVLIEAITSHPDVKLISWDMVQDLDPVPITTTVQAFFHSDRSQGMPYIFPGCATAVRRDIAQQVEWPNVGPSDWAYFSRIWHVLFGPFETEKAEDIDKGLLLIQWTLTVAYLHKTNRKWRKPIESVDEFEAKKYHLGWEQAQELSGATEHPAADSGAA